jgi:hypothetical protein
MLRFADDIAILAESEQDPTNIVNKTEEIMGKENNININKRKTKIMACNKDGDAHTRLSVNNRLIEDIFGE